MCICVYECIYARLGVSNWNLFSHCQLISFLFLKYVYVSFRTYKRYIELSCIYFLCYDTRFFFELNNNKKREWSGERRDTIYAKRENWLFEVLDTPSYLYICYLPSYWDIVKISIPTLAIQTYHSKYSEHGRFSYQ